MLRVLSRHQHVDCWFVFCFFFFSSRRRHTRLQGDWSSDVCSSDLGLLCPAVSFRVLRCNEAVYRLARQQNVAEHKRKHESADRPPHKNTTPIHEEKRMNDTPPPTPTQVLFIIRSEEHTSELQSPCNLVCRLLLEKKKKKT